MPLPTEVVVHPLVLLSAVDHYNRAAKDKKGARAIGVLLGSTFQGKCDVTNSFAVPFEEDRRNPQVWYLDHSFLRTARRIEMAEHAIGNQLLEGGIFFDLVARPVTRVARIE